MAYPWSRGRRDKIFSTSKSSEPCRESVRAIYRYLYIDVYVHGQVDSKSGLNTHSAEWRYMSARTFLSNPLSLSSAACTAGVPSSLSFRARSSLNSDKDRTSHSVSYASSAAVACCTGCSAGLTWVSMRTGKKMPGKEECIRDHRRDDGACDHRADEERILRLRDDVMIEAKERRDRAEGQAR